MPARCLKDKLIDLTLEALLGVVVLANVDSLLVLGVLHISKDIFVCLPFEQLVAHLLEAVVGCIV